MCACTSHQVSYHKEMNHADLVIWFSIISYLHFFPERICRKVPSLKMPMSRKKLDICIYVQELGGGQQYECAPLNCHHGMRQFKTPFMYA